MVFNKVLAICRIHVLKIVKISKNSSVSKYNRLDSTSAVNNKNIEYQ